MVTETEVTKMKKSFILLALLGLLMSVSCTKEEVVEECTISNEEIKRVAFLNFAKNFYNNKHNFQPRYSDNPNKRIFYWDAYGTAEVVMFECTPVGLNLIPNN